VLLLQIDFDKEALLTCRLIVRTVN